MKLTVREAAMKEIHTMDIPAHQGIRIAVMLSGG